jgi:DNA-binding NarL/FixJ family response regulator
MEAESRSRSQTGLVEPEAPQLTAREGEVLRLLAEGLTAAAIGRRLGISERTVHKHKERVYAKLGASDRLMAVLLAQRHGLLPPPAGPS